MATRLCYRDALFTGRDASVGRCKSWEVEVEVAKWVRSWSVMQLGPVEKIGNVVDASFAFYNESVMSSSSSSWASLFAFI